MHLKSITVKGFKSFPDRTHLRFAPGVSVIVGPNGCGKSNITDAVLWALGEQSPLAIRGQTMQDVIFAGGQGQRSRSAAEVEVVIDNADGEGPTEFSELSIMRRFERGGEGEYRINGARCRLADVVETLADANLGREMHSVIGQGKVEEIVHSKPRERRLLIEEAAGLGKHRKRRRRAQLKLERTRENLDRALDVEREARSRLRPLKRQAQAAEIHAKLEREANEARGRLLASELANHAELLAAAEGEGTAARSARDEQEALLAEAAKRREAIEERLAHRDRERTEEWGRLTALRAAHERLGARGEALASRAAQLRDGVERGRQALGELSLEVSATAGAEDPVGEQVAIAHAGIAAAAAALSELEGSTAPAERATALGRVRSGAERAARAARAGEELLGRESQDSLSSRVEDGAALLAELEELCEAIRVAGRATGERADDLERRVVGASDGGDGLAEELRACSRREADLRAELHARNERFTAAEVRLTQLRDRRSEREAELAKITARLGQGFDPGADALDEAGREELERKLERVSRRREQLGPVNPLAEREYEEASRRVAELEEQRTDTERAMAELETLIRETDRTIAAAFEETFAATRRNFEELVAELFPGGKGRLSLVEPARPRAPIGGAPGEHGPETEAGAGDGEIDAETEDEDGKDDRGVEIEVTPRGKATRRLTLLSGGEKTLVAIAFVFSVFLARPSPFYILDEVEAALDDANIDRFIKLVRRFSDRAQFVIVTHQKRTMDAADSLYGVSMSDGVTKVVSRKMPQARQAALAAPDAAIAAPGRAA